MIGRSFHAMGTSWWVHCDVPEVLDEARDLVLHAEAQLSRFLPDSALATLNRERTAESPLLADVTRAALRMRELTGGAFDPTLGARLCELGYDRTFAAIERPDGVIVALCPPPVEVRFDGGRVDLAGEGDLDLGGIAKGYTVDRVIEALLARGAREVLVDGGGDVRGVGGRWPIGVGFGLVVDSTAGAVATSSTRHRRWRTASGAEHHHVLDPSTGMPARSVLDTAAVVAPDAATADALATAALVAPDRVLPMLAGVGAGAVVRGRDGRWWTTPGAPFRAP